MENFKQKSSDLLCRTCLKGLENTKYDIFTMSHISEWLNLLTSLVVDENDGLPKYLCYKCFTKIEDFYEFRTMCIESTQKFRQLFKSNDGNVEKEEILLEIQVGDDDNENKKHHQQLEQQERIECSKIEEEVVNALANMVQIPNISQQQQQQENNDNDDDDDEQEKVFEAQLDALCNEDEDEDEYYADGEIKDIEGIESETVNNKSNHNEETNDEDDSVDDRCVDNDDDDDDDHNANSINDDGDYSVEEENHTDDDDNDDDDEDEDYDVGKSRKRKRKGRMKGVRSRRKKHMKREKVNNDSSPGSDSGGGGGKKSNQEIFTCEICDRRYFKKEKFEACMRSHKGLKPWVCPECKKEYRKKASLINHIKYEHNKNCEMYACPVEGCDKTYRLKQTMQVHYRRIHVKDLLIKDPKKMKSYICEQCGKSLKTLNALNQHRFIHTGDFPYKCEQCPKRCGTRYQLEVHLKRHKGIKNFICPICGLKKITQQELNTHMNYHSRDKTFTCKFCPYTSCNNGNVVRHERIVHHGIKTFECKFCGKTFGKAETLKHHVMTHTGEKPHECHLCGRRFIQPTALKTHLKRHDKGTTKTPTKNIAEIKIESSDETGIKSIGNTGIIETSEIVQAIEVSMISVEAKIE